MALLIDGGLRVAPIIAWQTEVTVNCVGCADTHPSPVSIPRVSQISHVQSTGAGPSVRPQLFDGKGIARTAHVAQHPLPGSVQ